MTERETSIAALRDRLTNLLAEWGSEMSAVLTELEQCRTRAGSAEHDSAERDERIAELDERLRAQDELVENLKADAESADALRRELHEREQEVERLRSELQSKGDLIRALRRDAEEAERLKVEAAHKDEELGSLRAEQGRLEAELRRLRATIDSLEETAAAESAEDEAEVESLRAELEARKSLIRSLRGDAERANTLEERLEEKRGLIQQLDATINAQANTIVELKRNAETWKKKYRAVKGSDATTATDLSAVSGAALAELAEVPADNDAGERTIAIDMRQSLLEARKAAQTGDG